MLSTDGCVAGTMVMRGETGRVVQHHGDGDLGVTGGGGGVSNVCRSKVDIKNLHCAGLVRCLTLLRLPAGLRAAEPAIGVVGRRPHYHKAARIRAPQLPVVLLLEVPVLDEAELWAWRHGAQ